MHKRIYLSAALLTLAGTEAAVASTYDEGQWVTTFIGGARLVPHGNFQDATAGSLSDLGALNGDYAGSSATVGINRLSFHDAFTAGPTFGIEAANVGGANVQPFVRLEYSELRGRTRQIGELTSPALASPAAIRGDFDDVNSWSLNFGARYFFTDAGPVRPFLAGYVGANRTDEMRAKFSVDGLTAGIGSEELLPSKTRFDGGVEGGVSFKIADQADLRLAVGADYVAARHKDTTALEPLGVSEVRMTDQRWSIPVDLGLSYRF